MGRRANAARRDRGGRSLRRGHYQQAAEIAARVARPRWRISQNRDEHQWPLTGPRQWSPAPDVVVVPLRDAPRVGHSNRGGPHPLSSPDPCRCHRRVWFRHGNQRSKPFDNAYDVFARYVDRTRLRISPGVNFQQVFGAGWEPVTLNRTFSGWIAIKAAWRREDTARAESRRKDRPSAYAAYPRRPPNSTLASTSSRPRQGISVGQSPSGGPLMK